MSDRRMKFEAASTAIGVTIATAIVIGFAFSPQRAGTPAMLIAIGLVYAIFTAIAVVRLRRRGDLQAIFRPSAGDLTLGAALAGLLYGAGRLTEMALAPRGSPREAWVMRLYLQLGDPEASGREMVGVAVFGIAALEEIVWRGLVMRELELAFGTRTALIASTLLFGLAHVPTMFLLGDPMAGPNPLIVLAALGCGLVWGGVYWRAKRLVPAIFTHALFSWAIVEFPIWRP